jgi:predicted metal-binding protein
VTWIIDDVDVVHFRHCMMMFGQPTPYKSAAKTAEEMVEHLARHDVSNNHSAPTSLAPCEQCILGLPVE